MSLLRKFVALVLLALWLPATQHCGLEAAGLIAADTHGVAAECCATSDSDPCTHDACAVVESGLVKTSNTLLKVSAPALVDLTPFLALPLGSLDLSGATDRAVAANARPRHWVAVWQFVRRAAPLSRAPSVVG